jgi:hypothetical protein
MLVCARGPIATVTGVTSLCTRVNQVDGYFLRESLAIREPTSHYVLGNCCDIAMSEVIRLSRLVSIRVRLGLLSFTIPVYHCIRDLHQTQRVAIRLGQYDNDGSVLGGLLVASSESGFFPSATTVARSAFLDRVVAPRGARTGNCRCGSWGSFMVCRTVLGGRNGGLFLSAHPGLSLAGL